MTARLLLAAVLAALLGAAGLLGGGAVTGAEGGGYAPGVGPGGRLSVPAVDFRKDWAQLGTYAIDGEDGASQFHVVYTQPESLAYYRAQGRFPDGTVLVKELFQAASGDLTTGHVSWAALDSNGEAAGWFVMVKDTEGRFPGNPLWGDGWGWALFEPGKPDASVTTDYKADCLGCHEPARATDLVYVQGYPALKGASR